MNKRFKLYEGDNIQSLKKMPDNSIDSVVTDPRYLFSILVGSNTKLFLKMLYNNKKAYEEKR